MSVTGFVALAIAAWATYASVRTIRRIGLRRFSLAVGRLGWDLGKVALGGAALVGGAMVTAAPRNADKNPGGPLDIDDGHDIWDPSDPVNYIRADSPVNPNNPGASYYLGDKKEGEV